MLFLSGDFAAIPHWEQLTKGFSQLSFIITLAGDDILKKKKPGAGQQSCFVCLMQFANIYSTLETTLAGTYVCVCVQQQIFFIVLRCILYSNRSAISLFLSFNLTNRFYFCQFWLCAMSQCHKLWTNTCLLVMSESGGRTMHHMMKSKKIWSWDYFWCCGHNI